MLEQIPDPEAYTQPPVNLVITTYQLAEDDHKNQIWKAAVTHVFSGETVERVHQITDAHKKTDTFFAASFRGIFPSKDGDIYLKNSEQEIVKK
jgi:hypothetical protein